jgi:hypothetical protein
LVFGFFGCFFWAFPPALLSSLQSSSN